MPLHSFEEISSPLETDTEKNPNEYDRIFHETESDLV